MNSLSVVLCQPPCQLCPHLTHPNWSHGLDDLTSPRCSHNRQIGEIFQPLVAFPSPDPEDSLLASHSLLLDDDNWWLETPGCSLLPVHIWTNRNMNTSSQNSRAEHIGLWGDYDL